MIKATILKHSKGLASECELITFELTMPRIILAEFNKHCSISNSTSSSRAVPFKTMVKFVKNNPFVPYKWGLTHKGMSTDKYETRRFNIMLKNFIWLLGLRFAIFTAKLLTLSNVTKQLANRLLEPWMYVKMIATSDLIGWNHMLSLRNTPNAEIHFKILAEKIQEAINDSVPQTLKVGQWHLVYSPVVSPTEETLFIEAGKLARVSYMNANKPEDSIASYTRGVTMMNDKHASPFEHCAECKASDKKYGRFHGFETHRTKLGI